MALDHHIEATSALEGDRKLCGNGVSAVFFFNWETCQFNHVRVVLFKKQNSFCGHMLMVEKEEK